MPVAIEPDGSKLLPVNVYKDQHLLRYLVTDLAFDTPGEVVFCSEGRTFRGTVLTFLQSRSGLNLLSKAGFLQYLTDLELNKGLLWAQLSRREFGTVEELFRAYAIGRVLGYLPKEAEDDDLWAVDLLLQPQVERLATALSWEPSRIINGVLKVIETFSDPAAVASYKSKRYKEKLARLSSAFLPHRATFHRFEIDEDHLEESAYQLLLLFS